MCKLTRNLVGQQSLSVESFKQLAELEPRLNILYLKAKAIRDDGTQPSFCANEHWYGYGEGKGLPGGLRGVLDDLVGFFAENPRLRTWEAHDLARRTVYDALPDCRNCSSCFPVSDIRRYRRRLARRRSRPVESNRRNRKVASGT